MLRSEFRYELPPDLIAQTARPRGESRMLVVTPGAPEPIRHGSFASFPSLLNPGDVLVINDTRVLPARLFAKPRAGMKRPIEVLLTRRIGVLRWECLCRPGRRVRPGDSLVFSDALSASVEAKRGDGTIVLAFEPARSASNPKGDEDGFWAELDRIGHAPLPPYIESREPRGRLLESYQTVYAERRGAIAAPTAGLHFSTRILEEVERHGNEIVHVTLHVGAGTFRPVTVDRIEDHVMVSETYEISEAAAEALNRARGNGRRIVAVGTTTVRTLESAVAAGNGTIASGRAETSLFITPRFEFQVVDAMLTNFHLPESTLLMLVSAFAGIDLVREAYTEAIRERYWFYSFGDCMFIENRAE